MNVLKRLPLEYFDFLPEQTNQKGLPNPICYLSIALKESKANKTLGKI